MTHRFNLPRLFALGAILSGMALQAPPTLQAQEAFEPLGLNLTWQQDPTTTMTVDWHVSDPAEAAVLEFRPLGASEWVTTEPDETFPFPFSDRHIHRVELTGLEPGTDHEFRFGAESTVYRFQTLPADIVRTPVRLAMGGDVRTSRERMEQTGRVAMEYEPHAIVFGGDLAYVNGDPRRVAQWYEWFEVTRDVFQTADGRIVPVVVAIGNHEIWHTRRLDEEDLHLEAEWGLEEGQATFFMTIFPQPSGTSYRVLDAGDYLSLVLLDTDHLEMIAGAQTDWLEETLAARVDVPHVFPVYHQPAYPSVRSFGNSGSQRVREFWSPLFEEYGVRVAFENHDHAYKRTVPIRAGVEHPGGVVYIGDGAWGVGTREIGRDHDEPAWYLKRATDQRHFILATLHGPHQHFLMVNEDGAIIDEYPQVLTRPGAAAVVAGVEPADVILGERVLQLLPPMMVDVDAEVLEAWTGTYLLEAGDLTLPLEISMSPGGNLRVDLSVLGYPEVALFPLSEDHFVLDRTDSELRFVLGEDGRASGVEVTFEDGTVLAPRIGDEDR
ncbi:MAG: metallophosphoesterase family protein [Gemmatimonadales bacterium]|nr:MAG: metallophosphoesterase family protein [Gemmatimonadales bacterium]